MRDALGSYGLVLTLLALLPFGLAVGALFVKEPVRGREVYSTE